MLPLFDNILRGFNFAFLVIILGLTGSLIAGQMDVHARVNMALFASVFGLVFDSFYAILANFFSIFAWPIVLFVLDFLNFVFTFSAATALAVGIRCHPCTSQSYLDGNAILEGSKDRCRKAQATVAFLYFCFFIFLAKLIFDLINLISGGATGSGVGIGKRRQPTIAQVSTNILEKKKKTIYHEQ